MNSKLIKVAESKPPASARIRQTTWSLGASFLKGLDLSALVSLTQYSGKPSRAEGTRSEQQILKNLPFHPVNLPKRRKCKCCSYSAKRRKWMHRAIEPRGGRWEEDPGTTG